MTLNLNSSNDLVDQHTRYMDLLEEMDPSTFAERNNRLKHLPNILDQLIFLDGYIVEAGVWKGDLYKIFQKYFGKNRCKGFDIEKYIDDPSIIYGDFRKIKDLHPFKSSVFVNGLGTWKNNKLSKIAGLDYAIKNLIVGGYYFDTHYFFEPVIEKTKLFKKVNIKNNNLFVVYQKVSHD